MGDLEAINSRNTGLSDSARQMLTRWLKSSECPTWKNIVHALRSRTVPKEGKARRLPKKYSETNTTTGSYTSVAQDFGKWQACCLCGLLLQHN